MNKAGVFICTLFLCATSGSVLCAGVSDMPLDKTAPVKDEIVENILKERNVKKPCAHTNYNYKSTVKIPVKISIKEKIKSENDVYEGQTIEFEVKNDVYYKKQLKVKKGDTIKARVGTIITNGMNGIPASIIFEAFQIQNIKSGQITDTLEVFGQDRSLFVFPLKLALTILPPTGSLTNFISGGHVKIRRGKTFTIYYHPEWL